METKYDIIETIKLISDWYNIFFKKKKYFINNSNNKNVLVLYHK